MTTMYTPDHEWINIEDHEAAVVGITHHAQEALGDVVFVELPEVGRTYKKGEVAGVVESVKAAADLYMPVGGEIIEVNEALRADPSLANTDPPVKRQRPNRRPNPPHAQDRTMRARPTRSRRLARHSPCLQRTMAPCPTPTRAAPPPRSPPRESA